jgi:hypothetical protein
VGTSGTPDPSALVGLVEVRVGSNGASAWTNVCFDGFTEANARVVCRMLGHGIGSNPLMFQDPFRRQQISGDFRCTGGESSLRGCQVGASFNTGCSGLGHVAQITCSATAAPPIAPPTAPPPAPACGVMRGAETGDGGQVKLSPQTPLDGGGIQGFLSVALPEDDSSGTVEVRACKSGFNEMAGTVACAQLGYVFGGGVNFDPPAGAAATGPMGLGNVSCEEYHGRLLDCQHSRACSGDADACRTSTDAVYLRCNAPMDFEVRLKHKLGARPTGKAEITGIVEFYSAEAGKWGTVCDDGLRSGTTLGINAARAICHSLRCADGTFDSVHIGDSEKTSPILMDDLNCPAGEDTVLKDCHSSGIGKHNCRNTEKVAVHCTMCTAQDVAKPSDAPSNGSGSSVTIIIVVVILAILGGGFAFMKMRKKQTASLSSVYSAVGNDMGSPSSDLDDDDDDKLIIADGDQSVGGTMKLQRDTDYDLTEAQNGEEALYDRANRTSENPYTMAAANDENDYSMADENVGDQGGNAPADMWGAENDYDQAM